MASGLYPLPPARPTLAPLLWGGLVDALHLFLVFAMWAAAVGGTFRHPLNAVGDLTAALLLAAAEVAWLHTGSAAQRKALLGVRMPFAIGALFFEGFVVGPTNPLVGGTLILFLVTGFLGFAAHDIGMAPFDHWRRLRAAEVACERAGMELESDGRWDLAR
ncbi:MAG: hypothetical protein ACREJ2_17820 [Planctomycetota bacterium]